MMTSNIKQFLKDTEKEIKKQLEEQESFGKKIVLKTYSDITSESAVDTGLFKSSHFITFNAPTQEIPTTPNDARIIAQQAVLATRSLFKVSSVHISNRLKYAEKLEAGHSQQQAPALYGRAEERARLLLNQRI